MLQLHGLAWDHERCWGPLDGSVARYGASHPDVQIRWDRQSLYDFGEGNLAVAARRYDLVVFDHPFVGDVARDRLLLPLDGFLSASDKVGFEADSVGASWRSYQANGQQWALPIDAAAQVCAYRCDLLLACGAELPTSHAEVLALGRLLRRKGQWLGLPCVPTDAMCLVMSLAAGAQDPIAVGAIFLDVPAVERIVEQLREMRALAHPSSGDWNPIRCYDHMRVHDDVVYVPYGFGYVNYAAARSGKNLRFGNVPVAGAQGALLGGAGIGISASTAHAQAAFDYALFLCSAEYQRGDYVLHGGQPASRSAWLDGPANRLSQGFFQDTLQTLNRAYLRPTKPGFIQFFRASGHDVVRAMEGRLAAAELAERLNQRFAAIG